MAPSASIVIIDQDTASRKSIEGFLKAIDHVTVAGSADTLDAGYDLVVRTKPMIVIMELNSDKERTFDTMKKMMSHFPGIAIFATSSDSTSENILKAMHSGATEFLLRPVSSSDLMHALTKVTHLMVPRQTTAAKEEGKVVTCFSPKGGMGNTTLATNLAVSLHQATDRPVVLVDLDLRGGDDAIFLNLKTKYTISDVTANIARLDRAFLEGVLAKHSSGIYLLAEPPRVEDADEITPNQIREVLDLLKTMFAYVVVDTEDSYGDRNLAAFDTSDLIFIVGVLSLPSIRNMQKALDVFDNLGYSRDKAKLVINRHIKKSDITIEDAQRTLNYKVFRNIPNDYNSVMASINRGLPVVMLEPHSEISRSYKDLARDTRDYLANSAGTVRGR